MNINPLGLLPIAIYLFGFLFLWMMVVYYSLRRAAKEVKERQDYILALGAERCRLLMKVQQKTVSPTALNAGDQLEILLKTISDPAYSIAQKLQANHELFAQASYLKSEWEKSEQLQTNPEYRRLKSELEAKEKELMIAQKKYYSAQKTYNTFIERAPAKLIAKVLGYKPA